MVDWLDSEEVFAELIYERNQALWWINRGGLFQSQAYIHWEAGQALDAIYDITQSLASYGAAISWVFYNNDNPLDTSDLLYYIHTFGTVNYKSICEAWGRNDFEGRAVTIAFIDRMRQLLWNEPFSAMWAARPEEQELW